MVKLPREIAPAFTLAAKPEVANDLYEAFVERMKENLGHKDLNRNICCNDDC